MLSRNYQVEDVSDNPEYWYKDIDFIVTSSASGLTKTFEVKWDTRINSTGNLYLELTNIHSKDGVGWYNFIEADMLAYGDAAAKVFYIIPVKELKKRVAQLPAKFAHCGLDSRGLLVNLNQIADIVKVL